MRLPGRRRERIGEAAGAHPREIAWRPPDKLRASPAGDGLVAQSIRAERQRLLDVYELEERDALLAIAQVTCVTAEDLVDPKSVQ